MVSSLETYCQNPIGIVWVVAPFSLKKKIERFNSRLSIQFKDEATYIDEEGKPLTLDAVKTFFSNSKYEFLDHSGWYYQ